MVGFLKAFCNFVFIKILSAPLSDSINSSSCFSTLFSHSANAYFVNAIYSWKLGWTSRWRSSLVKNKYDMEGAYTGRIIRIVVHSDARYFLLATSGNDTMVRSLLPGHQIHQWALVRGDEWILGRMIDNTHEHLLLEDRVPDQCLIGVGGPHWCGEWQFNSSHPPVMSIGDSRVLLLPGFVNLHLKDDDFPVCQMDLDVCSMMISSPDSRSDSR